MKIFAALLLSVFVLAGCGGSPEKQVVGSWKADAAKSSVTPGDKKVSEEEKKMAQAMLSTITLDLKEDKTFTMTIMFPLNGTWAMAGNKLTLTPTLKEGESMSFGGKKTIDFEVDASGTTMTSKLEDEGMSGTLVLTKSEAAK